MRRSPIERLIPKIELSLAASPSLGSCWSWAGARYPNGYAKFKMAGRFTLAHRTAYELLVGPIPEGLQLDHLCRNRACVNPDHLEPVTAQVNVRRGIGVGARNAQKTHCPKGHPYDEANTWTNERGWRYCRACQRKQHRVHDEQPVPALAEFFRKYEGRWIG